MNLCSNSVMNIMLYYVVDPTQVLSASDFNDLTNILDNLVEYTCQTEPPRSTVPTTGKALHV